jgi:hypothetical protein
MRFDLQMVFIGMPPWMFRHGSQPSLTYHVMLFYRIAVARETDSIRMITDGRGKAYTRKGRRIFIPNWLSKVSSIGIAMEFEIR